MAHTQVTRLSILCLTLLEFAVPLQALLKKIAPRKTSWNCKGATNNKKKELGSVFFLWTLNLNQLKPTYISTY